MLHLWAFPQEFVKYTLKEEVHALLKAGNSKMCRADDQFESKGCQAEEFRGRVSLLFYTSLQLIGQDPPTLWRSICLTQCTNLSAKLIQKCPHRNTQNNVWLSIWAPHVCLDDTKSTITQSIFTFSHHYPWWKTQYFFVPRAS